MIWAPSNTVWAAVKQSSTHDSIAGLPADAHTPCFRVARSAARASRNDVDFHLHETPSHRHVDSDVGITHGKSKSCANTYADAPVMHMNLCCRAGPPDPPFFFLQLASSDVMKSPKRCGRLTSTAALSGGVPRPSSLPCVSGWPCRSSSPRPMVVPEAATWYADFQREPGDIRTGAPAVPSSPQTTAI